MLEKLRIDSAVTQTDGEKFVRWNLHTLFSSSMYTSLTLQYDNNNLYLYSTFLTSGVAQGALQLHEEMRINKNRQIKTTVQ